MTILEAMHDRMQAAAAKPMNAHQEKMKACNAEATAKQLKRVDRQAFMKTCLSGSK
jgi:hypothetical protein